MEQRMGGYLDDEAELGSENEENDHVAHRINRNAAEENEDGLDEDLKDFIAIPADNEEIGQDDAVHSKWMEDMRA